MSKKHRLHMDELLALTREDGELFHDNKGQPVPIPLAFCPVADTHGHLTHFHGLDPSMALARASLAGVGLLGVPIDPTGDGANAIGLLAELDEWVDRAAAQVDELLSYGVRPAGEDPYALLDRVYVLAGTHPYGAAHFNASSEAHAAFEQLLESPRAVGVGEIGLDYGPYNKTDPQEQKRAFVEQLRVAHERGLPVELHIRDAEGDAEVQAHRDAELILREEGVPAAGCDLHCYTSGPEVMQPFVDLGCHVAFGGAATFARSDDIRAAAAACPTHLVLSETDSPYMAPAPLRGMQCEPAMAVFTVALVAEVRKEAGIASVAETRAALWNNAQAFFGVG